MRNRNLQALMDNYHNLTSDYDKALHLLYRCSAEGMLGMGIIQCQREFGKRLVKQVVKENKRLLGA